MLVALTRPVNRVDPPAPSRATDLADRWNRSHPDQLELLDAPVDRLERSDFSGVQVALRINRQVVKSTELAGRRAPLSESIEELQRLALEDHHLRLASVRDVQEFLPRISREGDPGGRLAVTAVRRVTLATDE